MAQHGRSQTPSSELAAAPPAVAPGPGRVSTPTSPSLGGAPARPRRRHAPLLPATGPGAGTLPITVPGPTGGTPIGTPGGTPTGQTTGQANGGDERRGHVRRVGNSADPRARARARARAPTPTAAASSVPDVASDPR